MSRYPTPSAFRMALEQRIANEARASDGKQRATDWYRKRVAFDRTLARLETIAPGEFTLKGALALHHRFGDAARRTQDMDFAGSSTGRMREVMQALDTAALGDFFSVHVARAPSVPLVQDEGVEAYRWSVEVRLDGRYFERITLDVGIGDSYDRDAVQRIKTQPILMFADIPPTEVNVVPLERHIAEKLHAYVQDRGDRENTRVKDIVDLALFAQMNLALSPEALRDAIDRTFAAHETPVPRDVPPPPSSWAARYPQTAEGVGVPPTVDGAWTEARRLLSTALATPPRIERTFMRPVVTEPSRSTSALRAELVFDSGCEAPAEQFDIGGMRSAVDGTGAVSYRYTGIESRVQPHAAFVDTGRTIVVSDATDVRAVRAAAQYARERWGNEPLAIHVDADHRSAVLRELARTPLVAANVDVAHDLAVVRAANAERPTLSRGSALKMTRSEPPTHEH